MKRFSPWVLAGVLLAAPAMHAVANEPGMYGEKGEHGWDADKVKQELGLTDDQVAKLKTLKESNRDQMKALWDKQKEISKKLEDQVNAKAADADIQNTLSEWKANHKAMADQHAQLMTQKESILTPTQQAKMLLAHKQRMKGHMGMKGHMKGHMKSDGMKK